MSNLIGAVRGMFEVEQARRTWTDPPDLGDRAGELPSTNRPAHTAEQIVARDDLSARIEQHQNLRAAARR